MFPKEKERRPTSLCGNMLLATLSTLCDLDILSVSLFTDSRNRFTASHGRVIALKSGTNLQLLGHDKLFDCA